MKRFNMKAKPWDYRSADVVPFVSPTGEWVHIEECRRLEHIERAAKAYIEAHDTPYTTGVSHDDYLIRCSDARAALRKALSE